MLRNLLIATPIMVLCLCFQALMVVLAVRYYTRKNQRDAQSTGVLHDVGILSAIMLIMMLGNFVQIALWAGVFSYLGEFKLFSDAVYHSAVNFATLGYGDVVMSSEHKLLGPLEAANGAIMFGVSTAIMVGAIQDLMRKKIVGREL
jgi:voltage-gated potassium channel Kch